MNARPHRAARSKSPLRAILIASAIAATLLYRRRWIHELRELKKSEAQALLARYLHGIIANLTPHVGSDELVMVIPAQ